MSLPCLVGLLEGEERRDLPVVPVPLIQPVEELVDVHLVLDGQAFQGGVYKLVFVVLVFADGRVLALNFVVPLFQYLHQQDKFVFAHEFAAAKMPHFEPGVLLPREQAGHFSFLVFVAVGEDYVLQGGSLLESVLFHE